MYRFNRNPVGPMQMRAPMQSFRPNPQRQPTMPMPAPQAPPLPQIHQGSPQGPMAAMGGMNPQAMQQLGGLFKSPYEVANNPDMQDAMIGMGPNPPTVDPNTLVAPAGVSPFQINGGPGGILGDIENLKSPLDQMQPGGLGFGGFGGFLGGLFG